MKTKQASTLTASPTTCFHVGWGDQNRASTPRAASVASASREGLLALLPNHLLSPSAAAVLDDELVGNSRHTCGVNVLAPSKQSEPCSPFAHGNAAQM
jgi:hypothetical protein